MGGDGAIGSGQGRFGGHEWMIARDGCQVAHRGTCALNRYVCEPFARVQAINIYA